MLTAALILVLQLTGLAQAAEVPSILDARDLLEVGATLNITENTIGDVLKEAANYTIRTEGDVNKKFINKNKKYRLMKIVRAEPAGQDKNILRNIKLEVDGKGNKKVPNLFKIRRKVKYPNYVRNHRQIYRGEFLDYKAKKHHQKHSEHKDGTITLEENSASESKVAPTFIHVPVIQHGNHDHNVRIISTKSPSITVTPSSSPSRAPSQSPSQTPSPVPSPTPTPASFLVSSLPPPSPSLLVSSRVPSPAPSPAPSLVKSPAPSLAPLLVKSPAPLLSPTPAPPLTPSVSPGSYHSSTAGRGYHYTTRSSFVSVQFGGSGGVTPSPSSRLQSSSSLPPLIPSYISSSTIPTVHHQASHAQLVSSTGSPHISTSSHPHIKTTLPPIQSSGPPKIYRSSISLKNGVPSTTTTPKIYKSSISPNKNIPLTTAGPKTRPKTPAIHLSSTTARVTTDSSTSPQQSLPVLPAVLKHPVVHSLPQVPVHHHPVPVLPVTHRPAGPLVVTPGTLAVGSRSHIDNLFREYESQGTLVSLYDENKNIKLLGPIAVRATGPTTFQVIDTNRFERHQKDKRDQLVVIPNFIQTNPVRVKTTKRPSLHFLPVEEKTGERQVVGSSINLSTPGSLEPVQDPFRNRRWPRSKPTPRSNSKPRQRSLKVRFQDLSNERSDLVPNRIVRFPS